MRYVKDYKVFEMLAKELSEDDFNKWSIEVDHIIDVFQDIADNYQLIIKTTYGAVATMKYQDYIDKNDVYRNFINGLPLGYEGFEVCIGVIDSNYDKNLDIMGELEPKFTMLSKRGWILDSVESKYNTKKFSKYVSSIGIYCKFKREGFTYALITNPAKKSS